MGGVIHWEGKPVSFETGETIAAALMRHGAAGTPWRVFCATGACQQCVVLVDGQHPVEACLTPACTGMKLVPQAPEAGGGDV